MSFIEEKIAEIISENDPMVASKVILEALREIAKGDPVIADDPDHCIGRCLDHACEKHFG